MLYIKGLVVSIYKSGRFFDNVFVIWGELNLSWVKKNKKKHPFGRKGCFILGINNIVADINKIYQEQHLQ